MPRPHLTALIGPLCLLLWLTSSIGGVSVADHAFSLPQPYPPAFTGRPGLYMWTVFGLMMLFLFSLGWLWEICWAMLEHPLPLRHPLTIARIERVLFLLAILCAEAPRVVLVLFWPESSSGERRFFAELAYHMAGVAFLLIFAAWLLDQMTGRLRDAQLSRYVPDISLTPERSQFSKLLWCAPLILLASVLLTYRQ